MTNDVRNNGKSFFNLKLLDSLCRAALIWDYVGSDLYTFVEETSCKYTAYAL